MKEPEVSIIILKDKEDDGSESPYIYKEETTIREIRCYNPKYGQNTACVCGHAYHRHFDWMEEDAAVGCKYCDCYTFRTDY
jgi:hypothetical protein